VRFHPALVLAFVVAYEKALAMVFIPMTVRPMPECAESLGPSTQLYFSGSTEARENHAQEMDGAGNQALQILIQSFSSLIPDQSPILEIGPFLRPLGQNLNKRGRFVVWEFDSLAAQQLAVQPNTLVYQGDLNALDKSGWDSFISDNRQRIHGDAQKPAGFGVAILSAVLNYLDHEILLPKLLDEMADGGLLFIGNGNMGDLDKMRGRRPLISSQILEHLLLDYSDRIEVLPESRFLHMGMTTDRTGIQLVARIHKSPWPKKNQYRFGKKLWIDYNFMPWRVSQHLAKQNPEPDAAVTYWFSQDRAVVEEALKDIANKRWLGFSDAFENRQARMELSLLSSRSFIEKILTADFGTPEAEKLEAIFFQSPFQQRFVPERHILQKALKISNQSERATYLENELSQLYTKLGEEEQKTWLRQLVVEKRKTSP
jgi:hypothetical protein